MQSTLRSFLDLPFSFFSFPDLPAVSLPPRASQTGAMRVGGHAPPLPENPAMSRKHTCRKSLTAGPKCTCHHGVCRKEAVQAKHVVLFSCNATIRSNFSSSQPHSSARGSYCQRETPIVQMIACATPRSSPSREANPDHNREKVGIRTQ